MSTLTDTIDQVDVMSYCQFFGWVWYCSL